MAGPDWTTDPNLAPFAAALTARREPTVKDIPDRLKVAMMDCEKPFHLWNVEREERDERIGWEKTPAYRIGRAAVDFGPPRDGRPGTVVPLSRLARSADEDRALLRASAFGARRSIGALLREDPAENNLGLPD